MGIFDTVQKFSDKMDRINEVVQDPSKAAQQAVMKGIGNHIQKKSEKKAQEAYDKDVIDMLGDEAAGQLFTTEKLAKNGSYQHQVQLAGIFLDTDSDLNNPVKGFDYAMMAAKSGRPEDIIADAIKLSDGDPFNDLPQNPAAACLLLMGLAMRGNEEGWYMLGALMWGNTDATFNLGVDLILRASAMGNADAQALIDSVS